MVTVTDTSAPKKSSSVPPSARHLFQEYDIDSWDESDELVINVIIQRLLEGGAIMELRWLFATYGEARVAKRVREGGLRGLTRKAFAYWRLVLGVTDYRRPPWMEKTDDPYPDPSNGMWGR